MIQESPQLPLNERPVSIATKRCKWCGKEKPLTEFHYCPEQSRHRAECKECYRAAMNARRDPIDNRRRVKAWQQANPDKRRAQSRKTYEAKRSNLRRSVASTLKTTRASCRRRGVVMEITTDDVVALFEAQSGRCVLTGRTLLWGTKGVQRDTLSIDRIDQSRGYVLGNVRLVTYQANFARNRFSDEELFEFCKAVLAWRDR
ncbi:MAG: hypothetical protein ACREE4_13740 [Stellaceae bacterium]